jgi:hypothetical protein
MTKIKTTCPRCGSDATTILHQTVRNGRPAWALSTSCPTCGHNEEADGVGFLPADLRKIVSDQEGFFELVLEADQPPVVALKQLQALLGLSMAEVALIKKQIPGPILSGTDFEVKCIGDNLRSRGVKVHVRPRGEGGSKTLDISQLGEDTYSRSGP